MTEKAQTTQVLYLEIEFLNGKIQVLTEVLLYLLKVFNVVFQIGIGPDSKLDSTL